ncbi:cell wall-binding repeat-containing protein [Chryseoglobus sp. 28M-23]|uniref:cell wall-binding repeat-containing protein n=1 Tax=Chryseoglobus sp. 28M-23 TaxID=2772253 RepID=UPI0017468BCB|nr:cell wall-binding repeat-containing protein [Chryseoglobus sp. 28M-23]QOD93223.1 cell wall-binding repeat-containing protein [Chryseoglobus sp. 28M-23]
MRSPRTATTGALLALLALLASPVTAASAAEPAAVPVRAFERPVTPIGDEPARMVDVEPGDFAAEGAALPADLQQALARDVGLSGAEWLAQSEAGNAAADVVADLTKVIDVVDARLEGYDLVVTVENAADARLAQSVGARVEFGSTAGVRGTEVIEGLEPAEDLLGGLPYIFNNAARCSVGFAGINTTSNQLQMLSAGHCEDVVGDQRRLASIDRPTISGGSLSTPLTTIGNGGLHVTDEYPNPGYGNDTFYDLGLTPVTGSGWVGKPEVVTWENSTSGAPLASPPLVLRDAGPAMAGTTLCKSGATTGWTCGLITDVDELVYVGNGTPSCPAITAGDYCVGAIEAAICVRGGDSGGPAVVGSRAVGISSAATNSTADSCAIAGNIGVFATLFSAFPEFEQVTKVYPNWEPLIDVSTPAVTRTGTDFSGTLADGTVRHSVDIEFSNGRTVSAPVGSDGTWSIDASNAYIATADYEVTARWGEGSRSDAVVGSISIPTGAVGGRVTTNDSSGAAISGANVRFHDTEGVFISQTTTDANGDFLAPSLAAGDYLVRVVDPSGNYTSRWFPNATSSASATPVTVTSEQTTSGIDVRLTDVPVWPPAVSRIAGSDRYATAAKIAQQYVPFAPGEGVVYVATGTGFADALSAAAAAAYLDAPLLLTAPTSLPSAIRTEIVRLKPHKIVIVGGTSVVSASVERTLRGLAPTVVRQAGSDRYSTSRVVTSGAFGAGGASTAFVATGSGFADALAAAAAAGKVGAPVILVDGSRSGVPSATRTLLANLGVTDVYVVGGTAVVSNGILSTIRGYGFIDSATRLAGSDRYTTSMAITQKIFPGSNPGGYFAVGTGYADALAGAALAGGKGEPLYIVPPNCVPRTVLTHMEATGVEQVRLLGGTAVLNSRVFALSHC